MFFFWGMSPIQLHYNLNTQIETIKIPNFKLKTKQLNQTNKTENYTKRIKNVNEKQ